ncbi:MAG: c-type cytochrome [Opitutales bacterium]
MAEKSTRSYYVLFTALGVLLSILVVLGYYKDQFRSWKTYQAQYVREELKRANTPQQHLLAATTPIQIRQIQLPELNRIDRCTTCHIASEDPSYGGYPQPLAYHPHHDQHPFEKFGCTVCHRGQGRATTTEAAHGHVEHWNEPMLPLRYIQASCGQCHQASDNPAAPLLARGSLLFETSGCLGCHKLGGTGGIIGPALDTVGARRTPEWLKKHFTDPSSVTPGSGMPPQKFKDADLEAITLFMLSQTGQNVSGYYASMKVIPNVLEGRRLFLQKGCFSCHSVGGQGGKIGPSLDDVALRRQPDWIMRHFRDPQAVTPGSVMPKFGFTEIQIRALTEFVLHLRDQQIALSLPTLLKPAERGQEVFRKYGCAGCHGQEGKGGVPNPNARSGEQVPNLQHVGDGYTKEELVAFIRRGQPDIPMLDPNRPRPPLFMPSWRGVIQEGELDDLAEYVLSLKKSEDVGF